LPEWLRSVFIPRHKIFELRKYRGYEKDLATQEDSAQKRTWISEKNGHPWRPGCIKSKTPEGSQAINCSLEASSSTQRGLKREQRLTKSEQYTLVYNSGSTQTDRLLVLKAMHNRLDYSRYGISVSKRVGNAVVRNRVKRILREILRLSKLCPGWDIILIARSPAATGDYHVIKASLEKLLSRARIKAD
jgi:ribonuclease P protein component